MAGLTPNQAAKRAHVSRGTVMKAVKSGAVEAQRQNSGWIIDPDSLDQWAAERTKVRDDTRTPPDTSEVEAQAAAVAECAVLRSVVADQRQMIESLMQSNEKLLDNINDERERSAAKIAKLEDQRDDLVRAMLDRPTGDRSLLSRLFRRS